MIMQKERIRVRFAPSPTGPLHIGGVRTAIYNYLFAKSNGGDFIFRIEDTDSERFVKGAEEYIIEALNWLGIRFDEGVGIGGKCGPYRQSERKTIYREYVNILLNNNHAYIAFDTPEELERRRRETPNFQYDAFTRMSMCNSLTMSTQEVKKRIASGDRYVVRFLVNPNREVLLYDMIRGEVRVKSEIIDDKVIYKSADNLPTYHLANVVDDHLMGITHVIRGEEWLPSAPLHVLLYEAFGWQDSMPRFAHLPLLLKPEGKGKLSKRDGDRLGFPVFPLEWRDSNGNIVANGYRESGYFPEAVVNFLSLLGWNPGTEQELFSLEELVEAFDISRCSKAGARFDHAKAVWFNHEYMLRKTPKEIAQAFAPIVLEHAPNESMTRIEAVCAMMKERVNFVNQLWALCSFFFIPPQSYDEKTCRKRWKEYSAQQITSLADLLESLDDFSASSQENIVESWMEKNGYSRGDVMNAWRLSLVGEGKGPGMFEISSFLGKEETVMRMRRAVKVLGVKENMA